MEVLTIILISAVMLISTVIVWLNFPGTFMMTGFMFLWAWVTGFDLITLNGILTILILALLLEVVEFALGGVAARLSGAGKRSAIFAIVGGLLGTIILGSMFFILGALVGLFAGSYLGAYLSEIRAGKDRAAARKAALGALLGNIAAKVLKSAAVLVLGIWMIKELI